MHVTDDDALFCTV